MFIPTNSDGQNFVNLRKTNREKKKSNFSLPLPESLSDAYRLLSFDLIFFILYVGPTCPFFFLSLPVSALKQFILSQFQFYLS